MTRVYVAGARPEERSALRLLLLDINMEVVGMAADWATAITSAPLTRLDMLLLDWELLPVHLPAQALAQFRLACPNIIVILLIGDLEKSQQTDLATSVDAFISRSAPADSVASRLLTVAASLHH